MSQGTIKQILEVSQRLREDCYSIVNIAGGDALKIYHTIQDDIKHRSGIMFTHDYNGFVTSFIKGHFSGPKTEASPMGNVNTIDWFYVDKNCRGRGIGTWLFETYAKHVLLHNVQDFRLYSEPTKKTLDFYEKQGFKIIGPEYFMKKTMAEKVI